MDKNVSSGLKKQMLIKTLVPMSFLTVIIAIVAFGTFSKAMEKEVSHELQNVCDVFQADFEKAYPGDMRKEGTEAILIYKGNTLLNDKNEMLDNIKQITGMDITVFYNDLRVLTTIKDATGNRISGTAANLQVNNDVLKAKENKFYNNVTVNDEPYFGYYKALYNSDGTCIGMIFAGKEAATVKKSIVGSIVPLILAALIGTVIAGVYVVNSSKKVVARIELLKQSLANVADGKLDGGIDTSILKQQDEISDMGRAIVHMQKDLKELVELDTLTKIYNRRSGERKLKDIINRAKNYSEEFSIAIGDIDFFKKVNDTYGHDAGDAVLKEVASILKNTVLTNGFVARWGGEEFLIVYNKNGYSKNVEITKEILEKIRKKTIQVTDETKINVTMTFGITEGSCDEEIRIMFNRADTLLYNGKENGRNQVVTDMEQEKHE